MLVNSYGYHPICTFFNLSRFQGPFSWKPFEDGRSYEMLSCRGSFITQQIHYRLPCLPTHLNLQIGGRLSQFCQRGWYNHPSFSCYPAYAARMVLHVTLLILCSSSAFSCKYGLPFDCFWLLTLSPGWEILNTKILWRDDLYKHVQYLSRKHL